MERVFRRRKSHRNVGVVCLVFFLLMGVFSSGTSLVFVLFWAFWVCLACVTLLTYWRERLKIDDDHVTMIEVIGRKQIDLAVISLARWRISPSGGSISLRTLTEKLTIHLDHFERAERLWLIRFFRKRLPEAVQENWALFCGKIALPLRDQNDQGNEHHAADTVVLTRRRWDWYLVPVILLSAIYGVVAYWKFQQPRMLAAPWMPTLLWLYLRFCTPRKGLPANRISAVPGQTSFLFFLLSWFGVAIAGLVVFTIWQPPMPHAAMFGSIAMACWVAVFLWRGRQLDLENRKRDERNAAVAVQQWDEGETGE